MKTTYDPVADAVYVQLFDIAPKGNVVTRVVGPGVSLDYVKQIPVGIEILDVTPRVTSAQLRELKRLPSGDEMLTMAEAVKESGLAAQTLRAQIGNGRLAATKRGRDWSIGRAALVNYLESRDARGRPAQLKRARRKTSAAHCLRPPISSARPARAIPL